MNESNTIDISQFFSKKNEEEGVWYEPVIFGEKIGIQFCMYGVNSNAAAEANEEYRKTLAELTKITDDKIRNEKLDSAIAKRVSRFIKDMKGANGKKIVNESGKELTKEDIPNFMEQSPIIAKALLEFVSETENFLVSKKNS